MNGQSEQTIVINVELTKGILVLLGSLLLSVVFFIYVSQGNGKAVASASRDAITSNGSRQYYLTTGTFDGASADIACATGYHMASLWEILDPSNLVYNTALGYTADDSGQGPPTIRNGWVRTGYEKSLSGAGQGNCDAWTNNSSGFGTVAWLNNEWGETAPSIHVWNAATGMCDFEPGYHVWCVAD